MYVIKGVGKTKSDRLNNSLNSEYPKQGNQKQNLNIAGEQVFISENICEAMAALYHCLPTLTFRAAFIVSG